MKTHKLHSQQALTINRCNNYAQVWVEGPGVTRNPLKNETIRLPKLKILWKNLAVAILLGLLQSNSAPPPLHHQDTKAKLPMSITPRNYLWVIAGLPLTNANYNLSVSLLREKYSEPYKLVDAHMQALSELNSLNNTLAALQLFYD